MISPHSLSDTRAVSHRTTRRTDDLSINLRNSRTTQQRYSLRREFSGLDQVVFHLFVALTLLLVRPLQLPRLRLLLLGVPSHNGYVFLQASSLEKSGRNGRHCHVKTRACFRKSSQRL